MNRHEILFSFANVKVHWKVNGEMSSPGRATLHSQLDADGAPTRLTVDYAAPGRTPLDDRSWLRANVTTPLKGHAFYELHWLANYEAESGGRTQLRLVTPRQNVTAAGQLETDDQVLILFFIDRLRFQVRILRVHHHQLATISRSFKSIEIEIPVSFTNYLMSSR